MTTQMQKMLDQQKRLEAKIERQDFKLRQNKYYENQRARKARTRRLIQKGALLEKYFQAENLSLDDTEELLKIFADYVNAKKPDKFKKTSLVKSRLVFLFLLIFWLLNVWILFSKIF